MATKEKERKGFGPDPEDTSSILYVQENDVVVPIRADDPTKLGKPIRAGDLWKEKN